MTILRPTLGRLLIDDAFLAKGPFLVKDGSSE
jgi:hypothetical protein